MADLLDFLDWTDDDAWAPIHEASIESMGWHWEPTRPIPAHADGTPITNVEWTRYLAMRRCRDCGVKVAGSRGGSENGGWFLCDDCGVIADCTAAWGGPQYNHTGQPLDALLAAQARRRAKYKGQHRASVGSAEDAGGTI